MNEVSLIVGVMNRFEPLIKSLKSWLSLPNITEIIIVDWNSTKNIAEQLEFLDNQKYFDSWTKINIIRVDNVGNWILTLALNLASKYVKNPLLLKVDADTILELDFFEKHPLYSTDKFFYSGNWKNARNNNEMHLNGVVYLPTNEFKNINGYNEHIRTYGWDDTDLYDRLVQSNMKKLDFNVDTIKHIPHSDKRRSSFSDLELKIIENMYISKSPDCIWNSEKEGTLYVELRDTVKLDKLNLNKMSVIPLDLEKYIPSSKIIAECNISAMRNILEKNGFPWECTANKSRKTLLELYSKRSLPKFIIEPKNGLGNKLRALASAAVIAKKRNRNLLIVWIPDIHYESKFSEHFISENLFVVSTNLSIEYNQNVDAISNNPPNVKCKVNSFSKPVKYNSDNDIYIISATIINDPCTSWYEECEWLKTNIKPLPEIQNKINNYKNLFNLKNTIGLHIRMGQNADTYSFEDWSNYSTEQLQTVSKNRGKCHYNYFMDEIDKIWSIYPNQTFLLCADDNKIYEAFQLNFPTLVGKPELSEESSRYDNINKIENKIFYTNKNVWDRSAKQIESAIIDVYLLSLCGKGMLGSSWSSFTELAQRLGQQNLKISGKDFGDRKFGVLCYPDSRNLGDDIQSIAALTFIPTYNNIPDFYINRDKQTEIYDYKGEKIKHENKLFKIKIIENGWYDGRQSILDYNEETNLHPFFISFHLNETFDLYENFEYRFAKQTARHSDKLLTEKTIKYLQKYHPVGTRDLHTLNLFQNAGIKAYHSCCLTLTLSPSKLNFFNPPSRKDIVVVDVNHREKFLYEKLVPPHVRQNVKFTTHGISENIPAHKEKRVLAMKLLEIYYNAKLVISDRLHACLPSIALGTPVLFLYNNMTNDPRYDDTLIELLGDGKSIPENWDWDNPKLTEKQIKLVKNLSENMIKKIEKFIKED